MYVYVGISFLYDRDGGRKKETILCVGILIVYNPKLFSCFLQNVCQSIGIPILACCESAVVHHKRTARTIGQTSHLAVFQVFVSFNTHRGEVDGAFRSAGVGTCIHV